MIEGRPMPHGGITVSTVVSAVTEDAVEDDVESIPISSLVLAGSPRLQGEDEGHIRSLAESDLPFPPIVVHRATLRVLDGMHRLRVALLRGDTTIDARFYDGSEEDAFVLAVRLNAGHGLPLSRADRSAAARRIMGSHPHWSDRRIAAATGLAARTVAGIRRSTTDVPQLNTRVGRDGRARPLNAADGRKRAAEVVAATPSASLRAIAKAAGVSVATAKDVKERLRLGHNPVPSEGRTTAATAPAASGRAKIVVRDTPSDPGVRTPHRPNREAEPTVLMLRRDPSLRFTEVGRLFLRLLGAHPLEPEAWERFVAGVPAHCAESVAQLARRHAEDWLYFANAVETLRSQDQQRGPGGKARPGEG